MKDTAKLNDLAIEYMTTKSEGIFEEIVLTLRQRYRTKFESIARTWNIARHDVESMLDKTIMNTLAAFDGRKNYENQFTRSFKNALIDCHRTTSRMSCEELTVDKPATENTPMFEVADDYDLEETVFSIKKEDQRQLISSLCDPRQVDETTTQIVELFPNYPSANALAKALGLDHKQVDRKLRKLARNFDENKFGHYRDYLSA